MASPCVPLRVALGLHSLELGGSQVNTVDLAGELRRHGHYVVLWAIDDRPHKTSIRPVAANAGFEAAVEEIPSLALDVDTPDDLEAMDAVLRQNPERAPRTAAVLGESAPEVGD